VEDATGVTGIGKPADRRHGDPAILIADPGKAASVLEWRPAFSNLQTIIRTAVDWHSRLLGEDRSDLSRKAAAGGSGTFPGSN
jgi:UDP-glucose 4-epimerase